jgi:hypothetical protein
MGAGTGVGLLRRIWDERRDEIMAMARGRDVQAVGCGRERQDDDEDDEDDDDDVARVVESVFECLETEYHSAVALSKTSKPTIKDESPESSQFRPETTPSSPNFAESVDHFSQGSSFDGQFIGFDGVAMGNFPCLKSPPQERNLMGMCLSQGQLWPDLRGTSAWNIE